MVDGTHRLTAGGVVDGQITDVKQHVAGHGSSSPGAAPDC